MVLSTSSESSEPAEVASDQGVANEVDEAAVARATVARRAREMGLEQLVDDACLLVTELVTNAILHGRGLCGLTVRPLGPGPRIEVRDASRVPRVLGWASEHALTGRGLRLVSSVASRWGVDPDGAGKVVWVELSGDVTCCSPTVSSRVGPTVRFSTPPGLGGCWPSHTEALTTS